MSDQQIDDGGPAYPGQCQSECKVDINEGMSLRDYFAAHASDTDILAAINAEYRRTNMMIEPTRQQARYLVADAMLAARKAGRQ